MNIDVRILGQQTPWSILHSWEEGQSLLDWQGWVTSPIRRGFPRSHCTEYNSFAYKWKHTSGTIKFAVDTGQEIVEISTGSHIGKRGTFTRSRVVVEASWWSGSLFFNTGVVDCIAGEWIRIEGTATNWTTYRSWGKKIYNKDKTYQRMGSTIECYQQSYIPCDWSRN